MFWMPREPCLKAQATYIEALANYHETSVEVERLIGQRVDKAKSDKS